MNKIIAAFHWSTSDKSISYMIIDENFNIRQQPVKYSFKNIGFDDFKIRAAEAINSFFNEINVISEAKKIQQIEIEYKIVGSGSPVHSFHTKLHKPSNQSEYVRETFMESFRGANKEKTLIERKLAEHQYRSKLRGNLLIKFKAQLKTLGLLEIKRGDAYKWHLWAIALHLTKSSYDKTTSELHEKLLTSDLASQIASEKRRAK